MDIYDLTTLGKDINGNYDLTQITFQLQTVSYEQYEVQSGEEMRIDLICESIYGNTDYVDILLNVNNIDNPLNIQEGALITYPVNNIDTLRYSGVDKTSDISTLANSNKSTRKDSNRKQYVENNLSLPPTILDQTTNQFDISGNNIVLGDGLF
jgi:hypothetical protein